MTLKPRNLLTALLLLAPIASLAQTTHGDALLVVSKQSHALSIVDADTLKVVAQVPVGEDPHEVTIGPDNRTAFVSNYGEGTLHTIARVDLVAQKPLAPIDITPLVGAHGLFIHDKTLWSTAEGSKSLITLDPATGRILSVLGTGQNKTHLIWVSSDGNKVVASNAGSQTMSLFDRVTVSPTVVPGAPMPPTSYTHPDWRHVLVPVGRAAEGFAVSPDERELWVGNDDGTISLIDLVLNTHTATIDPEVHGANRLKFTPDGHYVLVTTHTGKDLVVIDAHAHSVVKRIPIEQRGASGIQVQPDGRRAFIACPRDHYVAVVDLTTLEMIGKIDAGQEPDGLAWWHH
ncbi:MAG TPA: YncE family protein [Edaphobacter sp.]